MYHGNTRSRRTTQTAYANSANRKLSTTAIATIRTVNKSNAESRSKKTRPRANRVIQNIVQKPKNQIARNRTRLKSDVGPKKKSELNTLSLYLISQKSHVLKRGFFYHGSKTLANFWVQDCLE